MQARPCSDHLADEAVDKLLSVSVGTEALSEGVSLYLESAERRAELEWPEEVIGFLELRAAGDELVDEVLNAVDAMASELTSDDAVVGEGNSTSVDSAVSSLIDQLGDGVSGWEAVSDEWLNDSNHVPGGLVELHEDAVVQLSEPQQLQNLLWLWGKLVDTMKNKVLEKTLQNCSDQLYKYYGNFEILTVQSTMNIILLIAEKHRYSDDVAYPLILMTNATFGSDSTWKDPAFLASLLALTSAASAAVYSLKYFSALA